jgi:hypothetical protein
MFAQPSRSNLASPMSVPQGSPRQSSGMGGKGGPSQTSPGGMGGKGGGSPQGIGGPTVGQMNQAISQPMQPSMFSAASSMFGNQETQPSMTSSAPQYANYGNAASNDRAFNLPYSPAPAQMPGLPPMQPSMTSQAAGGIASKTLDPSSTNFTVADMQNAQPMWQMLPPLQPSLTSGPQGIAMGNHDPSLNLYRRDLLGESQMPSPQTQMSNFNLRPSVPTPTPRQTIPQGGGPNIPQGLMRRLQSFRGF